MRDPSSPHVGDPQARATQEIPPRIRRAVLRRDGRRCIVPGCNNHRWLDVHHLDPLSEGGDHDPQRLGTLCGTHHRRVHAGSLVVDGTASAGFSFRHADGTTYGGPLRPATVDLAGQAALALKHMGFKQNEARALVDAVLRAGPPDDLGEFVAAALRAS